MVIGHRKGYRFENNEHVHSTIQTVGSSCENMMGRNR